MSQVRSKTLQQPAKAPYDDIQPLIISYLDVVLELVAGESISSALDLEYGDPVKVVMYGTWADS